MCVTRSLTLVTIVLLFNACSTKESSPIVETPAHSSSTQNLTDLIEQEDLDGMRTYLADGGDLSAFPTLLNEALYSYSEPMARVLLDGGATIDAHDEYGYAPIHRAVEAGYTEIVRDLLILGVDPESRTQPAPALKPNQEAVEEIGFETVEEWRVGIAGRTPLMYAVRNDDMEILQLLMDAGAKIDTRSNMKQTALHIAAVSGQPKMVDFLVEHGAEVDARDYRGHTPLLYTLIATNDFATTPEAAHISVVRLLWYGADPGVKDNEGLDMLGLIADQFGMSREEFLEQTETDDSIAELEAIETEDNSRDEE